MASLNTGPVDLYSMTDIVLALSRPLLANKAIELINKISKTLPAAVADENRFFTT